MPKTVDEILDDFDFDKVQKHMESVNWTWALVGVPNKAYIYDTARDMLTRAERDCSKKMRYSFISTGGLYASAYYYKKEIYLRLAFELEQSMDW